MNIEVIRYRLPVYWVGALIDDDWTGLSDEEAQEVDDFVKHANDFRVWIDYAGDYRFSK
jgi:hypothetical protein